jgi:hypothetical protein
MPSISLQEWRGWRRRELDEIVRAHRALGGAGRGRRYATVQLNHAYAVLLSSQFQGFCRDLHSECAQHIVKSLPLALQNVIRGELGNFRRLDRGNANSSNIETDFARLGFRIWKSASSLDGRNGTRKDLLDELNEWRNAIAHQDFKSERLGARTTLRLSHVNSWRRACNQLAEVFDVVTCSYLSSLLGSQPWC